MPAILLDVKGHLVYTIELPLRHLLTCFQHNEMPRMDFLQSSQDMVLCYWEESHSTGKSKLQPNVKRQQADLTACSSKLHGLGRVSFSLPVLIHANDPSYISIIHNSAKPKHDPDVVGLYLARGSGSCGSIAALNDSAFIMAEANSKPPQHFSRNKDISSMEFRLFRPILERPSRLYGLSKDPDTINFLPAPISASRSSVNTTKPTIKARCRILRTMCRSNVITNLVDDTFWTVFWQIFRCHYKLWECGLHHQNIIRYNLMFDQAADGHPIGILNDFDLAHVGDSGTRRTCTPPFMALDLLKNYVNGKVVHQYQHDCESFAWLLMWICARFGNGREIYNPSFSEWLVGYSRGYNNSTNYMRCFAIKLHCRPEFLWPTQTYEKYWRAAYSMINLFRRNFLDTAAVLKGTETRPTEKEQSSVMYWVEEYRRVVQETTDFPPPIFWT